MSFSLIQPSRDLRKYIRHYWTIENNTSENMNYLMIPALSVDLIFYFSINPASTRSTSELVLKDIYISSVNNRLYTLPLGSGFHLFGIQFHSGYGNLFLDLPLKEVSGLQKLEILLPVFCSRIQEKLPSAFSDNSKISVIEDEILRVLIKNLTGNTPISADVDLISAELERSKIKQVCERYGIHPRSLERLFNRYIGASPRQYQRIKKIQKTITNIMFNPRDTLTDIALSSGYYDQPHFNREFLHFAENPPNQFRRQLQGTGNQTEILKSAMDIFNPSKGTAMS